MHRRNKISELCRTPKKYGVEVDIRSNGKQLVIHHDPLNEGELFEEWLRKFNHKTLILNVKEEGLESHLISLMSKYYIEDYFFLDQSFPFLVKWSKLGESRCAVRVSEFESIETALSLEGKVRWVWVDCFNVFPLNKLDADRLHDAGFNLCIVSPELQGRDAETYIPLMAREIISEGFPVEAVCTKQPQLWEQFPELYE